MSLSIPYTMLLTFCLTVMFGFAVVGFLYLSGIVA